MHVRQTLRGANIINNICVLSGKAVQRSYQSPHIQHAEECAPGGLREWLCNSTLVLKKLH